MVNMNSPVLALNSGMVPVDVCNIKEAICLQYLKKAAPIRVEEDIPIRSQFLSFPLPRVITLLNYHKIPKKKVVYSRLNIIYRDDMICQYCGEKHTIPELTVDHIIPISKWKFIHANRKPKHVNSWENQVAACKSCNKRKGSKMLKESGMRLIKKPNEPQYMPFLVISRDKAEKFGWIEYLNYNVRIVDAIR